MGVAHNSPPQYKLYFHTTHVCSALLQSHLMSTLPLKSDYFILFPTRWCPRQLEMAYKPIIKLYSIYIIELYIDISPYKP